MKKWVIYVFIMFILTLSVYAYSKEKSLEWLSNNADWTNGQITDNSFALLALKSNNYNLGTGYDITLQRKDVANCYPSGNCNVKDTAMATLALKSNNYDVAPMLNWLNSALTRADVRNWYIQITTTKAGECTITYDGTLSKTVTVDGTNKIKIDNKQVDWINVENDLQANLDQPIEPVRVDCTKVNDPGIIISLLRIVQNDFYIIQETQSSIANLVINNACYGIYPGTQCDEESSFYTAYVLKRLNEEVKVTPYLVGKVDNNLENAMMYTITGDQKYLENLISTQNPLGYWDNENIYVTSFAISALKNSAYRDQSGNATEWLKSKQITTDLVNNGSFGNVLNTGSALYLALGSATFTPTSGSSVCGNGIIELREQCDDGNLIFGDNCSPLCQIESEGCTTSLDCSINQECTNGVCTDIGCSTDLDCDTGKYCDTFTKECIPRVSECGDGFCDSTRENENSCPLDCKFEPVNSCGDGICDPSNEDSISCPLDCEEESSSNVLFWISLAVIAIILGVGGYFAYIKFFKKKGGGSEDKKFPFSFEEPRQQSISSPRQERRSAGKNTIDESLEKELDKSIKEAQKLLKK